MKIHLFSFFMLIQFIANAQHAEKIISEDGATLRVLDDSAYNVQEVAINFPFTKLVRCIIYLKGSDNPREELIRYSDSCFVYIQYGNEQQEKAKGLICLNTARKHYDTLSIPDVEKDGNLTLIFKDTVFVSYYFDKTGIWEEIESPLIVIRGAYKDGKKTGIWKVGRYEKNPIYPHYPFPDEVFKVECVEKYINGEYDSTYQPDYSFANIWDKLKGRWVFSNFNSLYRIQHVYIKQQPSESMHGMGITFKDSIYLFEGIDTKIKWKLENGIIYKYYSKDNVQRFKIDYISDFELYLTPLPPVSESKVSKKKKIALILCSCNTNMRKLPIALAIF